MSPISRAVCPPTRLPDNRQGETVTHQILAHWWAFSATKITSIFLNYYLWKWALWPEWHRSSVAGADCPLQDKPPQGQLITAALSLFTYSQCSSGSFQWPLFVLPAPGSSPRVVSIRPICAEFAATHIHTHKQRTVEGLSAIKLERV